MVLYSFVVELCLDISVPIERVRRLGRVVVFHGKCTVLIGVEVAVRWFVGSWVRRFVLV